MAKHKEFITLKIDKTNKTLMFYERNAESYAKKTANVDLSYLHEKFLNLIPKNGNIIDIGCGGGRDLLAFSLKGFHCIGIEPSPRLAEIAHQYSGCETVAIGIEEITYSENFDAAWACASLLHISKFNLPSALIKIHRALKHLGIFFLSMQEGSDESQHSDGRFFSRYSQNELISYIKDAGFDLLSVWKTGDALERGNTITWINILARRLS